MDVHRRLLSTSAEYAAARSAIENATDAVRGQRAAVRRDGADPVVVHVVWNTAAQNISQAQIDSQIDVLNRDFRATNTDVGIVPAPFTGLVADARIEFYLATEDPDGNPTTGVTRTQTTRHVVQHRRRGEVVGDRRHRPVAGRPVPEHLGRASSAAACSGTRSSRAARPTPTAWSSCTAGSAPTAPRPRRSTWAGPTTHEVGHYLNLFHIWGDDGTGCSGSDEVADTPNQGGPNFGVPTFPHVTCSNGPNGDLFVNYMDYTDDRGMVMFTQRPGGPDGGLPGHRAEQPRPGHGRPAPRRRNRPGPVVSWGAGRLDAFVLGTDLAMYHKWWDGRPGDRPSAATNTWVVSA